jgi:hypothetical protein
MELRQRLRKLAYRKRDELRCSSNRMERVMTFVWLVIGFAAWLAQNLAVFLLLHARSNSVRKTTTKSRKIAECVKTAQSPASVEAWDAIRVLYSGVPSLRPKPQSLALLALFLRAPLAAEAHSLSCGKLCATTP